MVPCNVKTSTFLAHSAVPVSFTEEDFEQVAAGNFVVKVIYLPDPQFQDLAVAGPDEVVSTRLEPGVNPDFEIGRYLTEKDRFSRIPRAAGALEYRGGEGTATLAVLQALLMPSEGAQPSSAGRPTQRIDAMTLAAEPRT